MKVSGARVVLVVDDDDSMREAIETLLEVSGFRTIPYGSAEAMLATEAGAPPFCIISDLNLPSMSGLGLLSELRRRDWQMPFIIITAYDSEASRAEAMRLGALAYLAKPFPSSALLTAMNGIAGWSGLQ